MSLQRRTTWNRRVNPETPEPAWETSESFWRKSYWSWDQRKIRSKKRTNQTTQLQEKTVPRYHKRGGWETGRLALLIGGRRGSPRTRRPASGTQTVSPTQHSSGWNGRTVQQTPPEDLGDLPGRLVRQERKEEAEGWFWAHRQGGTEPAITSPLGAASLPFFKQRVNCPEREGRSQKHTKKQGKLPVNLCYVWMSFWWLKSWRNSHGSSWLSL